MSTEGGDIEHLENEHKKDVYKQCVDPEDACDVAEYVEIYFEKGVPKGKWRRIISSCTDS